MLDYGTNGEETPPELNWLSRPAPETLRPGGFAYRQKAGPKIVQNRSKVEPIVPNVFAQLGAVAFTVAGEFEQEIPVVAPVGHMEDPPCPLSRLARAMVGVCQWLWISYNEKTSLKIAANPLKPTSISRNYFANSRLFRRHQTSIEYQYRL